jgi:type IV secretion system protein VirB5
MPATHKSITYKPLDAPNPFLEGGDKAYADLLQNQINETAWWRRIGVFSLLVFVINLCFFIYAVNQQKTVPVLVNVMPSGESQFLGEVRHNGDLQIPEAAILYQIRKFISNLRSVSTDYQVLYDNIDECFIMATANYSPVLRQTLLSASPFDLVGKTRRTVSIESVLHVTERSYQVNWTENTLDTSSNQKTAKMRAVVTIRLITPNDSTIRRNPLGIYIENCEITEL